MKRIRQIKEHYLHPVSETLDNLVARITPESIYPEIDWGPPVGKEIVIWRPARKKRKIVKPR